MSKLKILFAGLFLFLIIIGCTNNKNNKINYREEMRKFVEEISSYAKGKYNNFIIIPQNGHELITKDGELAQKYIDSIDAIGREDLFYGYNNDNENTPISIINEIIPFIDITKNNGLKVLVTDYCWDEVKIDDSYEQNYNRGYISFAADRRNLDDIPVYPNSPYNENENDIISIKSAKNFLYFINPENEYNTKMDFVNALKNTNYDLLIIDLFFNDEQLTENDVLSIKLKNNGHKRLVVCYMSIGEAEDYRYYWQKRWNNSPPSWLLDENPDWPGNYKVKYWDIEWKSIIFGASDAFLNRILDSGFDGVYLDIIDAYEYFEYEK